MASIQLDWYKNWFDEYYVKIYGHRDDSDALRQLELIISTTGLSHDHKILDLGCGFGRHVRFLHNEGYQVWGLDLSDKLIRIGLQQAPYLKLIVGDMRHIPGSFDVILSLFTSFGYFSEHKENQKVIHSVSESLPANGIFWLDFLNPTFVKDNLIPRSSRTVDDQIHVIEERVISKGYIEKHISILGDDIRRTYYERVRLYEKSEIEAMLELAGLKPVQVFGNYNGTPWTSKSERMIFFARKAR